MRKLIFALVASGLLLQPAFAAGGLSVGKPSYGGTGCPAGTALVSLSRGGNNLSLRFTRYRVVAGKGNDFDRQACSLSVPIAVPAGKTLSVVGADYHGYTKLPAGASATFSVEYFTPGTRGQVVDRTVQGPSSGAVTFSDRGTPLTTACGADTILRINTSLRVTGAGKAEISASIRSQEVRTALSYRLELRDC